MTMSAYVRELRSALGSRRILMPSVAGIVRDASGGLLLVRQRDDGVWSTPGGTIELTETPADAVVREVWEETGLLVRPTHLVAVYGGPDFVVRYPNGDETQYISAMFACSVESGELRKGTDETTDARFWPYSEASRLPLSPWLPRVLERLYVGGAQPWFEPSRWRP
jgi:ADP-ribose pyrophosphatase YjhB (NUDIX family)